MSKGAIVFAEDEPGLRAMIGALLKAGGYTPVPVSDGAQCLRMLSQMQPRALLLDIAMPTLDGLQTLKAVRGSHALSMVPVIMVTSHGEAEVLQEALRNGAAGVILKPFRAEEFIPRMERCIAQARARR
ncbi:response regulator receiver domain-containing protein [Nitrospirillum amazonense]|uniref:Response regulator receiver domain-containing protein n=1 Tax=Nitrospirillum amazonense TaxID=28077 RepID=A0A560FBK3_9PROT|nr:response regulator [Nitrospirillum amazonense]TWB18994.1 response regulator receiver domain-containing protein [Nitrospirillum amazonense]